MQQVRGWLGLGLLCAVCSITRLYHTVESCITPSSRHDLCLFAVQRLRPDFLFWLLNILLFKGEEKADAADLQVCIGLVPDRARMRYAAVAPAGLVVATPPACAMQVVTG